MKYTSLIVFLFLPFYAHAAEVRCGWIENPTPANVFFIDKDSSWTISIQGGYSVDDSSIDKIPNLDSSSSKFVKTNRDYGFSCTCLNVEVNKEEKKILKVLSSESLELKQCLEDSAIRGKVPVR